MAGPARNRTSGSREGLTEYLIVVALAVLVVTGILAVFGQEIREFFGIRRTVPSAETDASAKTPDPHLEGR
jgi:uncharacterized iron-regulated membrane protein